MTDGEKAFKEASEKIKSEVQEDRMKEEKSMVAAKNQIAQLAADSTLAQMYAESAQIGSENISNELPLLKVHSTGKSKNTLSDGTEPKNGAFFYKPTGQAFDEVYCHILTISRGFEAQGFNSEEQKFNQIVAGLIIDGAEYKPFFMYMTGLKLQALWDFGKEIKKYVHQKPIAIPMFALKVKLTTKTAETKYGKSWVVNFELVSAEDGTPEIILDAGKFQFVKDSVAIMEDTIGGLIATKSSEETPLEAEEEKMPF